MPIASNSSSTRAACRRSARPGPHSVQAGGRLSGQCRRERSDRPRFNSFRSRYGNGTPEASTAAAYASSAASRSARIASRSRWLMPPVWERSRARRSSCCRRSSVESSRLCRSGDGKGVPLQPVMQVYSGSLGTHPIQGRIMATPRNRVAVRLPSPTRPTHPEAPGPDVDPNHGSAAPGGRQTGHRRRMLSGVVWC